MKKIAFIIVVLLNFGISAQNEFTYDQFILEVLNKDFGVQIAKNNASIAENENNIGNAGYLPTISISADQNWSQTSARQEFLTGQVNEANNAKNTALNLVAALNWTFFDGFRMFARDKKLDLMEESAQLNLRAEMEMKVYQASISFYTLLVLKEMNSIYEESISLTKARYDQMQSKFENGAISQMEFIQTQLDLTADSSLYLTNLRDIEAIKASLNALIARDQSVEFDAIGELPSIEEILTWESIREKALANNANLLISKSAIAISEQERKEVLSAWYPQLSFYAGYNYGRAQNGVGFLLSNQSYGPNVGISLKWDILSGLSRIQNTRNSALTISNTELANAQRNLEIEAELKGAFVNYEFARTNMIFEERNQLVAIEVEEIMSAAFESGAFTPLELREFQFAVIESKSRMLDAKLQFLVSELNIKLLSGSFEVN